MSEDWQLAWLHVFERHRPHFDWFPASGTLASVRCTGGTVPQRHVVLGYEGLAHVFPRHADNDTREAVELN